MRILLDTHVLLFWLAGAQELSPAQRHAIAQAGPEEPILVCGISLWEIATLHDLGRMRLDRPLREWLERATAPPLVRIVPITPAVAARVAELPDSFHRDPADRIIVSAAIVSGAVLLTRDRRIIESGLIRTV